MNDATGGWYEIADRTLLRLTGSDRQRWLHNFCTADIKALDPGQGCEAFILNVKGKTLAHAIVLMSEFDLTIIVMGQPEISLFDHLDRYIITEDVQLADISDQFQLFYACGALADEMFQSTLPQTAAECSHALVRDGTIAVAAHIGHGRDWLVLCANTMSPVWPESMAELDDATFDEVRVAGRWPLTGIDLTQNHLPQEFCRNQQAISFEKGCYLGQETVARLDALGHVNRFFVTLEFPGNAVVGPDLELRKGDKPVGRVTTGNRPNADRIGALGFVRRLHATRGSELDSDAGAAVITSDQE